MQPQTSTNRLQATTSFMPGTFAPDMKTTPGQRLKQSITDSGKSQRQVSIAIGVERQSITNAIRRDRVSPELAQAVATVTGDRWEWIYSGQLPRGRETDDSGSVRLLSQAVRRVPVISLAQAKAWPRSVGEMREMHDVAVDIELAAGLSDAAFCIVIDDDSMRDNSAESVQRGDKVIIDPAIPPQPGDLVVAEMVGQGSILFRKYRERGHDSGGVAHIELVPLNPDYAPSSGVVSDEIRIIGVMVEHRRQRRRA